MGETLLKTEIVYIYSLMKRILAFALLLCHMNFSMFLPQVAEKDVFYAGGQQTDDINSVIEYIRVSLGYDHTTDDEDDDSGQNFHLANAVDYFYQREIIIIEDQKFTSLNSIAFAGYTVSKLTSPYYDIIAPPPEA